MKHIFKMKSLHKQELKKKQNEGENFIALARKT
jgi:hypothetical protein